jgi:hypothetical protein
MNNKDGDSIPVVNEGTASGFVIGYNVSTTQLTGTFVATGTGCTYAAGIGNNCAVTMTNPFAFADTNYKVSGCTVTGGTGLNGVTQAAAPSQGNIFPVYEVGLNTAGAGGGTIYCTVVHQ